jgi:magnesium chelatase family protein
MVARCLSNTVVGVQGKIVEIEVDLTRGLPALNIVGLPGNAVRESKDRVRSAIENSGFAFPLKRITVNLAPAEIRKNGNAFDLPIALAILAATGVVSSQKIEQLMIVGELALDGRIRAVKSVLASAMEARRRGAKAILAPLENCNKAHIAGIPVMGAKSLTEAIDVVNNTKYLSADQLKATEGPLSEKKQIQCNLDYKDVKGLPFAVRAMEIAAAGRHNILITGPPGSGKTMLASRLPTILPELSQTESLETTEIHSATSENASEIDALITTPPFRAPHNTITRAGLFGGGVPINPGEVTLAHNGVLFLDEFPEISRENREGLRLPMSNQQISISRRGQSIIMPADFQLVAAGNPCPCGNFGNTQTPCSCTFSEKSRYQSRISGPVADRIDLHIVVENLSPNQLAYSPNGLSSAKIQSNVKAARMIQEKRYVSFDFSVNSRIPVSLLKLIIPLGKSEQALLTKVADEMKIGARSIHNVMRMARTIADLDRSDKVCEDHIFEATMYRTSDVSSQR